MIYQDLISVYKGFLGPEGVSPSTINIRTSNEDRTYQVAGALLYGMDPSTKDVLWPVHVQPSNVSWVVWSYRFVVNEVLR